MRKTRSRAYAVASAAAACAASFNASAFQFELGDSDVTLRWDNTVKYSTAWRVKDQSPGLTSPIASANLDDGDRNFGKGLISNRLDLFSESDIVYRRQYGARISAAAWYDSVYNTSNDNPGPPSAGPNQSSVPYNQFTSATKRLHGRKAELLDAFVFGRFDLGETQLNVRAGRHSVLWGESLFFGSNGIAGAMAPVDVIKLASVPGTQFKEAIRPVPQISSQWQLTNELSLGGFYQFKWEPNRLPAVGSYFSGIDFAADGGENLFAGGPVPATRLADQKARNRGQGGIQLRFQGQDTDVGLYAVRFHSKGFQLVNHLYPAGLQNYQLAYHEGIVAYGASASRTFDSIQVAVEGSIRRNQDLATTRAFDPGALAGGPVTSNNAGNPAYAVGKTAHINASSMWALPPSFMAREATLLGEIMWNRTLSVDKNPGAVSPNSTRDSVAIRLLFEPTYRQVLTGLDLGVPIGLGYSPKGSRSRVLGAALPPENGGDFTIGLNGSYLDAWRFSLSYTHFFGGEGTLLTGLPPDLSYQQFLKDRNFVSFSLRRTF